MNPQQNQSSTDLGWKQLEDALSLCFKLFKIGFAVAALGFLFSGVHTVPQGKIGLIQRLGHWQKHIEEPGLHIAYPPFIDRVLILEPQKREILNIDHFHPELETRTAATNATALLTGDGQLLHSRWSLTYRVSDPIASFKYFGVPVDNINLYELITPQLEQLTLGAIIRQTGKYSIDDILKNQNSYRRAVTADLRQQLMTQSFGAPIGVSIEEFNLQNLNVPSSTKDAFQNVQRQLLYKDQTRQQAIIKRKNIQQKVIAHTSQTLGQAHALAERIKSDLKAEANQVISLQQQDANYLKSTWLPFQLQNLISRAMENNNMQTFWVEPGAELRLELGKDPRIDQLRRENERESKKSQGSFGPRRTIR
jgi:membrane protease subunit HflK